MPEYLVAGVDFSGAKTEPNDTWITYAKVSGLGLDVMEVRKVGSHALAKEIASRAGLRAVGIDCPFSIPKDFIEWLAAKKLKAPYETWQEVAQEIAFTSLDDFISLAKEFKKETKRVTDKATPATAQSPLHRGNPSMIQMTFHGMKLLAMLPPNNFFVLPFQDEIKEGCAVLEVYPRATLRSLGIDDSAYKSADKKEQDKVRSRRHHILRDLISLRDRKGITYKHFPRLNVDKKFEHQFVESDHALDSLLACYTVAMFLTEPTHVSDPFATDDMDVLVEGWIYFPKKVED